MHEQRWRFGHDRLRERVMRGLDPAARAALHARLAEDLEAIHGEGPAHAARIAHHYREAGRPGPAARFYALAGDAALARGAPGEASAMLEQAVLLHDRVDVPALWRVRVWRGLTQARYGLGQLGGTDDALRRACSAAGVPLPSGRLGWWRALGRGVGEQIARRAGLAQRLGLDPVDETDRAIREELLVALWAHEIYVWLTRPDIHVVCTLRGLNLEEALGASSRTNFRSAIAFLLSYTPLHRLCRHYLDRAEATSPPGSHAETELLRIHSIVEVNQGRTAEGDASAARAVACARARRDDVSLMYSLVQLQLAAGGRDDYPRVLAISSEIEALAARAESPRFATIALLGQGLAWTQLGDLAQAEAVLDRAMAAPGHELGPLQEALGAGFSALCALRRGRLARADALALRALSAVDRARWPMLELRHALFCGLEVLLAEDRDDLPAAPIRRALAVFHRLERRFPAAEPSAQLFQGRYEWRAGRPARAAACLRRSVRAAERTDARYEGAVARYWLGLLAASAPGRRHVPEGAARHLGAALAAFERLGAVREAARARAALGGVARAT
jgi:tetratricopeptide (TPR) repeat protein